MTRKGKSTGSVTAAEVFVAMDITVISTSIERILATGGAVMFGQTRDQEKLIVTVYADGQREVEYCSDAKEAEAHLQGMSL